MRARTSKRRQKTSTARPHYFWDKFDEGLDEEIALAVINLEAAVGDDGEEGTISSLTDASLASIDREGLDKPENAVGLLRMSTFECTLNAAEGLYKDAEQDDIHPTYDTYERTYTSSLEDYNARTIPTLSFDQSLSILGVLTPDMYKTGKGDLRWVPAVDEETSPYGAILLSRNYLTEPVTLSADGLFELDYHLEVLVEVNSGEIMHLHTNWAYLDLGGSLTSDNETMQVLALGGLEELEQDVEEACGG